jgi:hypothetical protein
MPAVVQPQNWGVCCLTMAGAIVLGLGALLPLSAQERGLSSTGPLLTGDPSTGRPNPGERFRKHKTRLLEQRKATLQAEAAYNTGRLAREIAQIAIQEYVECVFPQELAEVERGIKLAESNLARSKDRLDWARNNSYKGFPPYAHERLPAELELKRARFLLEQAQSNKKLLVEYTKAKRIKELTGELDKALSTESVRKAAWELEKSWESEIERRVMPWQVIVANLGAR